MKISNEIKAWIGFIIIGIIFSVVASFFYEADFITVLRAVFGSVYVLFLPGYVMMRCFFNDLEDWIEKGAVSFGLSIAVVVVTVIIANIILQVKINALSVFLILLVAMILSVVAKKLWDKHGVNLKKKITSKKPKKISK